MDLICMKPERKDVSGGIYLLKPSELGYFYRWRYIDTGISVYQKKGKCFIQYFAPSNPPLPSEYNIESYNTACLYQSNDYGYFYPYGVHVYLKKDNMNIDPDRDLLVFVKPTEYYIWTDGVTASSKEWEIVKAEYQGKEYKYLGLLKIPRFDQHECFHVYDYWFIGNSEAEIRKKIENPNFLDFLSVLKIERC